MFGIGQVAAVSIATFPMESGDTATTSHIIARKHRGSSDDTNLAWCCFQCNVCKGTDIASLDEGSDDLIRLFNPRKQHWNDHFDMDGGWIYGKTAVGRVTVFILQMNHPIQRITRENLMDADLWDDPPQL